MPETHSFVVDEWSDLLEEIPLSSTEIFEMIQKYQLKFLSVRDRRVEWEISFPMFVESFYDYTIKFGKIPDQETFYKHYLSINHVFFDEHHFSDEIMLGLKARVYRTYPSLVRDIYFSKYVSEQLRNCKSIYNMKLDIEKGIDLMLIKDGKYFGVNLYTDTTRAYIGREKKQYRHSKFENVENVELPVDFKGSLKCGDFFLYGDKELDKLRNIIDL